MGLELQAILPQFPKRSNYMYLTIELDTFSFSFFGGGVSLCSWLTQTGIELAAPACLLGTVIMHYHTPLKDTYSSQKCLLLSLNKKKIISWL